MAPSAAKAVPDTKASLKNFELIILKTPGKSRPHARNISLI
jgi:hypothetical protein